VHNGAGLDIDALQQHVAHTGSVTGFARAEPLQAQELLELEVDLLIPAAVEGVLNESNAHRIRAGVIVEGANGPTTAAADRVFSQAGKLVVPDILANAGGVVVSYFEWVQGSNAYWWSAREVDERLEQRMLQAWDGVTATAGARGLSLREAATVTAVQKVAEAHQIRGLYP
jgi:glutamate dehydrogenase (NAD(P)+)